MSLPVLFAAAALWGLSFFAARTARLHLRAWFYSALEYTQARLLEQSARFPFPRPLSPALWLGGYFETDRRRLVWAHLGGAAVPVLSAILLLTLRPGTALTGTAFLLLLQALPLLLQLLSRPHGADGKRHERFNRCAPLRARDRQLAALEAKKTRITALGRRCFPPGRDDVPPDANTVRDEGLVGALARF